MGEGKVKVSHQQLAAAAMEGEPGMARPAMAKPGMARLGLAIMPAMAQPMPGMARMGHRWCLRLMGRMVSPSPPKP